MEAINQVITTGTLIVSRGSAQYVVKLKITKNFALAQESHFRSNKVSLTSLVDPLCVYIHMCGH
jgi:hypothetical protein